MGGLASYPIVVEELSKKKKDPKKLLELDVWVSETLPATIKSRSDTHMSKAEISKMTTWKLMRGKFRPRLQNLVDSNDEKDIIAATKKAASVSLPGSTKEAITALTTLKGIGPATASAALCALSNGNVPFMSDEAVMAVLGQTKIDYNIKTYMEYAVRMDAKTKELNTLISKQDSTWTSHMVEKAMWATENAKKMGVDITGVKVSKDGVQHRKPEEETQILSKDPSQIAAEDKTEPTPKQVKAQGKKNEAVKQSEAKTEQSQVAQNSAYPTRRTSKRQSEAQLAAKAAKKAKQ
ncbi:hypothetical protein SARC_00495 [Sphaeroforma arctica JP610]|uniref:Uncharacterized protein n=1 Tax=Sphaeroforma arctica JP610 TaxID=667725 RepID=A0A0L0GEG5_9EUKA|nr:hypothetical protein SARC_00495 [Sphaeroforma arctica JP610]KNC87405.1 hypothetical protein SARC_00495 [Sphaeroforma arctica JP610]|eukprot:XP_014161307.1 hypothetical protein SARC_00495 [Sphaeroforma arctica JP610]